MIKVSDILNMGLTDIRHTETKFLETNEPWKKNQLMEKVNKSRKQECKDQVKKSFAYCY